jgi:O-methyltransferase
MMMDAAGNQRATEMARRLGYALNYYPDLGLMPVDYTEEELRIIRMVKPYTMTGHERIQALIHSVKYIVGNKIPGAIVECGVWKGGSILAVIHTLLNLNCQDRRLYLYDTFEGMPQPTEHDISYRGEVAAEMFSRAQINPKSSTLGQIGLEEVKNNVLATGYAPQNIHFVKGCVEATIPNEAPDAIALLRLDTDWYESTKHELEHLYPRLSKGGIIIVDDYGHWKGAQKAVDEYLQANQIPLFLCRVDYTCRIGQKMNL